MKCRASVSTRIFAGVGLLGMALCGACADTPDRTGAPRRYVTDLDYLESGRQAVEAYLDGLEGGEGEALRSAIERSRSATARLASVFGENQSGGSTASLGSCVLLGDGSLCATAAHTISERGGGALRIVLPDGRTLHARVVQSGAQPHQPRSDDADWAVLELSEASQVRGVSLATERPEPGETVFVLGYPAISGLGPEGYVRREMLDRRTRLAALALIAKVRTTPEAAQGAGLELDVVAGSLGTGGMSGGGVFDKSGRLLGILTGMAVRLGSDGRPAYFLTACSADAFASSIAEVPQSQSW